MDAPPPHAVTAWLRASRGDSMTQERLAEDIERVTGWHISRDRYSKYESGSLPVGKKVLAHFVEYWASRGVPGPTTPLPMTSSGTGTTAPELAALVTAINSLVTEMRLDREADQARQRDEIAVAVRQAVEPLWRELRGGRPASAEQAPAAETPAGQQ